MKYYIIAGEASGDLHGSNLIKAIHRADGAATIRCWGGDLMQQAGATLVKHYRDLAFMGFVEVLLHLPTILRNLAFCKQDIAAFDPQVLVLIDYPGFNLRIAKWARSRGIRVVYYISPQVWAWKENRVPSMMQCIDQMLVILPFEESYYRRRWNWQVTYVGHPLLEAVEQFKAGAVAAPPPTKPVIAVLPGSRKQEILKKLPIMLQASQAFPQYQFVIAKAPGLEDDFYQSLIEAYPNVTAVSNQTYPLLQQATAALVTSGTATLETALFEVPQVVCYKGNALSYEIAKRLVNIKYISLVNLIMDKSVVKELIQHDLTVANLVAELQQILPGTPQRASIINDYHELRNLLKSQSGASDNAAAIICKPQQEL